MKTSLSLSQAIEGYLLDAQARRLSAHTICDYGNSFRKFQAFLGDPLLDDITADDVRRFMADLATPRQAPGVAVRPVKALSKKQCLNIHTGLGALWTWATRNGYASVHVVHQIERPRPEQPAIVPLSLEDVRALLAVCDRSIGYQRAGQRVTDYDRPTAIRDRAMILILLDTGVRASELCELQIRGVDTRNQRITVWGKGSKQRQLPLGPSAAKALWRHLAMNRKEARVNEPVFVALGGKPMTRDALLKLLYRLGERAGVADVHPHRFRHTFAIEYLRNGGNTRALQEALGHETLDMIRRYTRIADADLVAGHKTASPVEHWRL